ncbi:hypothetical protein [Brevibacillus nitrificans]|nr:hypothetical protein [Brevibacillus nitrificans]MDR7317508.1 hypothetical protein [Brevibacillus nitrificans]
MFPMPGNSLKEVKKGSGFGRFGLTNLLKQNEQVRISATPAK